MRKYFTEKLFNRFSIMAYFVAGLGVERFFITGKPISFSDWIITVGLLLASIFL